MPELTLADVERLEAGVAKCTAAIHEFAERERRGDWPTIKASKEARKRAQSALKAMQAVGADHLPALLALAREALERRRDADAPDILEPTKPVASFVLEATFVPAGDAPPFIPEDRDHA